jgi:hypothetical protein
VKSHRCVASDLRVERRRSPLVREEHDAHLKKSCGRVGEWAGGWVGGWEDAWVGGWVGGWVGACVRAWVGACVRTWVGGRVGGCEEHDTHRATKVVQLKATAPSSVHDRRIVDRPK